MKKQLHCAKCDINRADGNFCRTCGNKLETIILQPCSGCGKDLSFYDQFCRWCGKPVNVSDYDVCYCGDYRYQHDKGKGKCQICSWNPTTPDKPCKSFKMAYDNEPIPDFLNTTATDISGG